MISSIFSSAGGIAGVIAGIVFVGNYLIPIVPPAWSTLISAILGLIALYYHGEVVKALRAQGITAKGI